MAPLITPSGDVTSDPIVKAELLNKYFPSIFQTNNNTISPSPQQLPILSIDPVFTIAEVKTRMRKFDPKSAGGLDGVPPIFLKRCQHSLSPPLAHLFSLSYTHSYLPPSGRLAYITPIFKKGDPACVSNYRPISLTSTTCKLMKSIIKDILCSSLLAAGRISKHQHAFITKHSTTTNPLESTYDWTVSLNNQNPLDIL